MNIIFAVLVSSILAGIAACKKALTISGVLLAWILCCFDSYFGGWTAFVIMAGTFILTVTADKLAGKRADPFGVRLKTGIRDAYRIFCNVGIASVAMAVYAFSKSEVFLYVYAAVMAESLSDSLASKIGPLKKSRVIDICSFKELKPGLSGGISLLGTVSSFAGAFIIGLISLGFSGNLEASSMVVLAGFLGSVFDSFLGSSLQVKYRCNVCGCITEKYMHCDRKTTVYKGLFFINNDCVNLLSNCFSFLFSAVIIDWII